MRQNIAGANAALQQIHYHFATLECDFVFARIHRRNAVEAHGRKSDQFHHRGHSICGVLTAARARTGTGHIFERQQIGVAHLARGIRANGLEHILNGDVFAFVLAGGNRPSVEHEAGQVHACKRHGGRGDCLVATDYADRRVEKLSAADQLDGVSNHLATHERRLHAFCAHGLAVGDGYGVEFHRSAAGGANAFFHLGRKAPQVEVAGHGFDPGIGYGDERLGEIVVGEADCLVHGARRSLVAPVGDVATAMFEVDVHGSDEDSVADGRNRVIGRRGNRLI